MALPSGLNQARLTLSIVAQWTSRGLLPSVQTTALASGIAAAMVAEVQGNALVVPTALVAPSGGGPVTGGGTVT